MTQYESKLLHYLQSEYKHTGKQFIDYSTILANCGITDSDLLERTMQQLESDELISRGEYVGTVKLIALPK